MKVDIHLYNKESELDYIGYVEWDKFDPDRFWDLCNWRHWKKEKPESLFANISSCSHGICFTNPDTNEIWMAKSIGWLVGNESEIKEYIRKNKNDLTWI